MSCCWALFAFIGTNAVMILFGQNEVWVQTIFLYLATCVFCLFGLQTLSINRVGGGGVAKKIKNKTMHFDLHSLVIAKNI